MTLTPTDCSIGIEIAAMQDAWCVYEHWMQLSAEPGTPPDLVFVGACKLREVFNLTQGRNNSEWQALAASRPDMSVFIRVIGITPDAIEAQRAASNHVHSLPAVPRCNLRGYNVASSTRRIRCSNGMTYDSQSDAAAQLDCSQASISQHLKYGRPRTVKGHTFTYATE
jgi:hypothetical protein